MADDEDDLAAAMAMSLGQSSAAPAPPAPQSAAQAAAAALRANPSGALAEADSVGVVAKLLGNLARSPGEEKFRRVRVGNSKISKALGCDGARELLAAAGFAEAGDALEVPAQVPAAEVAAAAREALEALASVGLGPFLLAAQLRADSAVRCVCALPQGGLATGAMDNLVRVYSQGFESEPRLLSGHQRRAGVDGVLAVAAMGPESIASAGRDGKILLWRNGAVESTLEGHGEGVQGTNVHVVCCLARRDDGSLFSGGWDKTVRAWHGGAQSGVLQGHEVAVNAVAILPGGDIASGSGDQTIGIWRGGARLRSVGAGAPVRALCACGDSGLLASATNDGFARVWDPASGKQLAEMRVANTYLLSIGFCASSGELAAGADDGTLAVMALAGDGGLRLVERIQLCGEVYGLAFLESGDLQRPPGTRAARCGRGAPCGQPRRRRGRSTPPGRGRCRRTDVTLGGRKMALQWNRGEEPQAVARRFVEANGLDPAHAGDVTAFVLQQHQAMAGPGAGAAHGGSYDFSYPVEVADGRRLKISWNRGDDPQQVAVAFARQHGGIAADELPAIAQFLQQVSGGPAAPTFVQQAPAAAPEPPEAQKQQALAQVTAMGFSEAQARAALQASGWSLELAVQALLG
ncbi:unnamed protein product [Prorocentrum cordatum]|uniref:Guanine nucleotide-binding protein subunit beta-like protein n=1 Tax=Prorocentrum cordatum TaxID=2364126 RepID=A0ABN9YAJ0_9DINO|nr:unnamed protein product [Polarella glacialis]